MLKALFVFVAIFLLDFAYVRYTLATTARDEHASGAYAAAIIVLSGGAAVGYTAEPWLLVPAAIGAYVGTVVAVRWK
jgi:hypothetical protein